MGGEGMSHPAREWVQMRQRLSAWSPPWATLPRATFSAPLQPPGGPWPRAEGAGPTGTRAWRPDSLRTESACVYECACVYVHECVCGVREGEADRKGGSDSGGKDWGLESSQSLQKQILAGMPHCSLLTSAGSEFSLQEPALSPFGLGGTRALCMTCLSSRVSRGLSWDLRVEGPQKSLQTSPQGGLCSGTRGERPASVGVCAGLLGVVESLRSVSSLDCGQVT